MRKIDKEKFVLSIKNLIIQSQYFLPEDVLQYLKTAIDLETNSLAKDVLFKILENAKMASYLQLPLCQDTGIPQFFLEIGPNIIFDFNIKDLILEVVEKVYEEEKFRRSCVVDPILRDKNSNCASVYVDYIDKDEKFKISILIRGGGSENTIYTKNFLPTLDITEIFSDILDSISRMLVYSCPPVVVGIGIGGTVDESLILAKKSLLRRINQRNNNIFYAKLEDELKQKLNSLGIGPLGLGGYNSVLDVFIEVKPTHIALLPVSVVLQCHSFRRHSILI